MATIVGEQTITHNSESLSFKKSWDAKYEGEIKKGTTTIKKASITNGSALWRLTHGMRGNIESHKFSIELNRYRDGETKEDARLVKVDVLMTCEHDDPVEEAELTALVTTVSTYLPTIMADVIGDVTE